MGLTFLGGLLIAAVFAGIVWLFIAMGNQSAKKFKKDHPEAATIWIMNQRFIGVNVKKVDGKKPKAFGYGTVSSPDGVYLLPGDHVLSLEHGNADPEVEKDPEYKKLKFSEMNVSVEAGKDYTLQFSEKPGQYALIEGKPKGE